KPHQLESSKEVYGFKLHIDRSHESSGLFGALNDQMDAPCYHSNAAPMNKGSHGDEPGTRLMMDTGIALALALGFTAGLQHALDPDHLVAVSTIVSEHKSITRSSLIGTFWGVGHTASLFAVGVVVILLRTSIPPGVARWLEVPVGVMLIALGLN